MRSSRKTIVLAAALGIAVLTGVAAWLARGALLEFRGFKIRDGGVSSDARSALLLRVHPETNRVLGIHHVELDGRD